MSTPAEEIAIDIDALDAKADEEAAKKAKNGANGSDPDAITVETVEKTLPAAAKPVLTPEEGLEKLQKQLADEKAARIAAEQHAHEASQAEAKARGEVQTTQLDQIKGAIEQATQAGDVLESKYAEAAAIGDWSAAAKIQREMSTNAARLLQLENGKISLEKAPKPVPRSPTDPVEQMIASNRLSPISAAWIRAHPEYVRDPNKNQKMVAAHALAIADGHVADSDGYFRSIEDTLKITPAVTRTESAEDPMAAAAQPVEPPRRAAPAAPVSRSGRDTNGSRPNTVRLTPAEVEAAEASGLTIEEYARNKLALKKEGKLS